MMCNYIPGLFLLFNLLEKWCVLVTVNGLSSCLFSSELRIALLGSISLSSYNVCSHAFCLCFALPSIHVLDSASHSWSSAQKLLLLGFLCTTRYVLSSCANFLLLACSASRFWQFPSTWHAPWNGGSPWLVQGTYLPLLQLIHPCSSAVRCAPQSSASVNRPYYHSEKWKPTRLAPVQCSVSCFSQHRI